MTYEYPHDMFDDAPAEPERKPEAPLKRQHFTKGIVGLMLPMPPTANTYWRTMQMKIKRAPPVELETLRRLAAKLKWVDLSPKSDAGEMESLGKLVDEYARGNFRAMTYLSKDAKAYKEAVAQRMADKHLQFNTEQLLEITILVCPATKAKMDIDNRIKPLLDALKDAHVFEDDSQIWKVSAERGPVIKGGRVVVNLKPFIPDVDGAFERHQFTGT